MPELLEQLHAGRRDRLHHARHVRDRRIVADAERERGGGMHRRPLHNGKAGAAFGSLQMVGDQIIVDVAAGEIGRMRSPDDAIGNFHRPDTDRRQDSVVHSRSLFRRFGSSHRSAAVNREDLPGDDARFVAGKIDRQIRDFLRLDLSTAPIRIGDKTRSYIRVPCSGASVHLTEAPLSIEKICPVTTRDSSLAR